MKRLTPSYLPLTLTTTLLTATTVVSDDVMTKPLLTEPYKKPLSDSPAAVDAEAEEVQLDVEVTWPGGVCPALPAGRVPVLSNPPSVNDGWLLALQANDDDSSLSVDLPFSFGLFGSIYDSLFINNNGNLSFNGPVGEFTSTGFPVEGFPMVAPFWADVDTRSGLGHVWKKNISPNVFAVAWDTVGYFNVKGDKRNTFMVMISDGNDDTMGSGINVCFCYADMQWTTGDASQGVDGFGGVPATVGVNEGNGVNFLQFGRYDEPGDGLNGVDFLDDQTTCFSVSSDTDVNLPPVAIGLPNENTIELECDGSLDDFIITFAGPEGDQTVSLVVTGEDPADLVIAIENGSPAVLSISWTPTEATVQEVVINATDDGEPPASTQVTLTLRYPGPCGTVPTTSSPTGKPTQSPTVGSVGTKSSKIGSKAAKSKSMKTMSKASKRSRQ